MFFAPSGRLWALGAALLVAACAGTDAGRQAQAPSSSSAATSITFEELQPGLCNPVLFEKRNDSHTGPGYINPPNNLSARVTWSVASPAGGQHTVAIRYSNGGTTPRSGELLVNGVADSKRKVPLLPTGAWTQWETASFVVNLAPGQNSLVLRATSDTGLPNIDSMTVTGANPSPGNCGKAAPGLAAKAPVDESRLKAAPVGWVTQGTGVTGGGEVAPVVVSTLEALQRLANDAQPRVIHVAGRLKGTLSVGSNKTIVGLPGAEIASDAGALRLMGSRNVIIQNLTFVGVHARNSPNTVLHDVENVWLDHNTFIDGNPDLMVVSGTSNWVTISWNLFRHTLFGHEHAGVNIGARDTATESVGRLKVTLHHNLFAELVNERMPRVRFGQVHSFNNLADAGTDDLSRSYYAVRAGFDANVRSERNVYRNFKGPSWWWSSEFLGAEHATVFNYARGNENSILESVEDVCLPDCVVGPIDVKEHEGVMGKAGFYSVGRAFVPPYSYVAESTAGLEARVRAGAGAR